MKTMIFTLEKSHHLNENGDNKYPIKNTPLDKPFVNLANEKGEMKNEVDLTVEQPVWLEIIGDQTNKNIKNSIEGLDE